MFHVHLSTFEIKIIKYYLDWWRIMKRDKHNDICETIHP